MNLFQKIQRFSFLPIAMSIILLVSSMFTLLLNEKDYSQSLAVIAFIFLIIGVVWQFINHLNKKTLEL